MKGPILPQLPAVVKHFAQNRYGSASRDGGGIGDLRHSWHSVNRKPQTPHIISSHLRSSLTALTRPENQSDTSLRQQKTPQQIYILVLSDIEGLLHAVEQATREHALDSSWTLKIVQACVDAPPFELLEAADVIVADIEKVVPHLHQATRLKWLQGTGPSTNAFLRELEVARKAAMKRREATLDRRAEVAQHLEEVESKRGEIARQMASVKRELERACTQVHDIPKRDLDEIRAYTTPPDPVRLCMEAVQQLLLGESGGAKRGGGHGNGHGSGSGHAAGGAGAAGEGVDWETLKKLAIQSDFKQQLQRIDPTTLPRPVQRHLRAHYLGRPDFALERQRKASKACAALSEWARAQIEYAEVWVELAPFRAQLAEHEEAARAKRVELSEVDRLIKLSTDPDFVLTRVGGQGRSAAEYCLAQILAMEGRLAADAGRGGAMTTMMSTSGKGGGGLGARAGHQVGPPPSAGGRRRLRLLTDLQVVVLGSGDLGMEVIHLLRGVGCAVNGLFRTRDGKGSRDYEDLFTSEELPAYMRRADYVINALPHTPTTERLLGAATLDYCREGVSIISLGAHEVLDMPAVAAAMRRGLVGGLVVDSPQGDDLPLGPLDRGDVTITPGIAARAGTSCAGCARGCHGCSGAEHVAAVFGDNLKAFAWGAQRHARHAGGGAAAAAAGGGGGGSSESRQGTSHGIRRGVSLPPGVTVAESGAAGRGGGGSRPLGGGGGVGGGGLHDDAGSHSLGSLPSAVGGAAAGGGGAGVNGSSATLHHAASAGALGSIQSRLSTSLRNAFAPRMKYVVQVPVGY